MAVLSARVNVSPEVALLLFVARQKATSALGKVPFKESSLPAVGVLSK